MALGARASGITPFFKTLPFKDERKSIEAGRPIFVDVEVCEIRFAGSKDCGVYRSHTYSHWETDEETGEQVHLTYAERWPRQYQQFLTKQSQTKSGTPLDYVPFLSDAKRMELRAFSIYTIEALAELDGQPLKNLGIGGRDLKNKAIEYLSSTSHDATIMRQQQQIEALISKVELLQADRKLIGTAPATMTEAVPTPPEPEGDPQEDADDSDGEGDDERVVAASRDTPAELIGMTREEIKAFIAERTGKRPVGNPSTRNLVRIAQELGR